MILVVHRQDAGLRSRLDHDAGGPLWSTETVSTYVYKRAFEWNTFDLGYPSAIAAVWFIVVLVFVVGLSWFLRQRERLEY